jgi:hypothetical protein
MTGNLFLPEKVFAMSEKKYSNIEFVKAMGSPSGLSGPQPSGLYGTLPEDDWLFRMKYADAEESAMGWVHAHTIDIKHKSLHAVDEHGKPIGPKQLATYKGWDVDFAEKILLRLEKAGRIRRDVPWDQPSTGRKGRGKIYICGYVPAAHEEHEATGAKPKKKGVCTNPLLSKSYVKRQLEALPPENLKALLSWDKHFEKFKPKFFADAANDSRGIIDVIQYKGYEAFGVKLKRLKKRAKPAGLLKVTLLNLPDSVQTPLPPEFVQTAIGGLYTGNKPFVQTDQNGSVSGANGTQNHEVPPNGNRRAFLDSDLDKTSSSSSLGTTQTTTTTSSSTPTEPERDRVLEAMEKWCGEVDAVMATRMGNECRAKVSDITDGEISDFIEIVAKDRGKLRLIQRADSPSVYLIAAVVNKLTPERLAKHRTEKPEPSEEVCPKCGHQSMEPGRRCSNCHLTRAEAREVANESAMGASGGD